MDATPWIAAADGGRRQPVLILLCPQMKRASERGRCRRQGGDMNAFNPYSIPAILTLCCFSALVLVTIPRARRSRRNRLFLAICIFGVMLNIDIVFAFHSRSAAAALAVSRADHLLLVFSLPVYIQFFHAYLDVKNRKWLEWTAYGFSAALMLLTPTQWYIAAMEPHFFGYFARAGRLYPIFGFGGLLVTVYVLSLLYRAMKAENRPEKKNRLQYLLTGFGLMGFLNGLNVLPILGLEVYPPGNLSFIPLIVFAVGLFRHDLLDMGFLIEKGLLHSLVSILLTAGFALVLATASTLVNGQPDPGSLWFPIFLFFSAALVIGPVRNRIRTAVDRRFFRRSYDFRQTLKSASRKIVAVLDAERICHTIGGVLHYALQVEAWALLDREPSSGRLSPLTVKAPEDHPMHRPAAAPVQILTRCASATGRPILRSGIAGPASGIARSEQRQAMEDVGAEAALPLPFSSGQAGLLLLGQKSSRRLYSPEDVDLLETLAGQTALALENARSCRQLKTLNRELEQKVAERTRELKSALAEKERTLDQLIRSESLAALGQLVAGVAHELNNPLASAKSLVQSVAEDLTRASACDPAGNLADDLAFVDRELGRARDIVSSLLGLSRQSQEYTEAVDLNAVVGDTLRLLFNQYKHLQVRFEQHLSPDLPCIEGNASNLGQVVLNIVKNAIQALGEDDGRIRLQTAGRPATGEVEFTCTDSGPGIEPGKEEDIFKPFFTTKPPGQGTGLGLYLSHEIVTRHGGALMVTPTADTGACFILRLPIGQCSETAKPGIDESTKI
jgi:two-component system NtrC family sensor kinase